jgi:XisH protein
MPAKDLFHDAVKNGLIKEGWTITDDPLHLRISLKVDFYIDLGAEKMFAAEKDGEKIAVEVKSFAGNSDISEFHTALGQFLNYQDALEIKQPNRVLFLAVPIDTYETFFQDAFISASISKHKLRILVYNPNDEVITKWLK